MAARNKYRRLLELASVVQQEADSAGVGKSIAIKQHTGGKRSLADRFDEAVTIEELRSASRTLFRDGHYARAVEQAYKCLDNLVKEKSQLPDAFGAGLMRTAFSAQNPILKLSDLTSNSQKDEQQGYMEIFAGAMTGIRNPRAHEHKFVDEPEVALEMLVLANHLMRMLERSTVSQPQSVQASS